ncbi:hypothetical protein K461DRAFT_322542 [Myriangium duriaei CBS 260.36]|uniref:BTB domain-containing protein n=1 Tax=Myriangium duriaei CBS 260.36 TaxID=1168546 RepID=A0A9P4MEJ5_9PEZI|nr:hypothetical protein K461DRAFT_322542 [Myriangium duriaei CBS 260.36]
MQFPIYGGVVRVMEARGAEEQQRRMGQSTQELCNSGMFSDCQIKLASITMRFHTLILARACPYFERAFFGGFMESTARVLDFSGEDQEAALALLQFIYMFEPAVIFGLPNINYALWTKTYVLADKTGFLPLKDALTDCFKEVSAHSLTFGEFLGVVKGIEEQSPFLDDFLRSTMGNCIRNNMTLLKSLNFAQRQTLFAETLSIWDTIIKEVPSSADKMWHYRCGNSKCQKHFSLEGLVPDIRACPVCKKKMRHPALNADVSSGLLVRVGPTLPN